MGYLARYTFDPKKVIDEVLYLLLNDGSGQMSQKNIGKMFS